MKPAARIVGLLAALALLAGCQQPQSEPAATTPASTAALTPAAKREQRLTTGTISDPKTFNPIMVTDSASGVALGDIFEGLVRLNPKTTEVEPLLAERWEYNGDGTVCTFHLRRDVRWHDGRPFTARDVVFTFKTIFDERVPNSTKHVLTIDGKPLKVEQVDDHTVRFVLPQPFAPLLNSIGSEIIPEHILGEALAKSTFAQQWGIDTPPEKLVGTGPYRMTQYVAAQYIRFRRNPDYWKRDEQGQVLPYLEEQTLLIVPNQDTLYLKFLAGQTDIHYPRPEEIGDLQAKSQQLAFAVNEIGIDTGTLFVTFNRNPRHYEAGGKRNPRLHWFTDQHFLQAIAHAIDKKSMILNCFNGYGVPAVADISPENKLFHNPNLKDREYSLDQARRLLAEGGYTDRNGDGVIEDREGTPLEFSLYTNSGNQVREKMCSILKEDWTKLGMKVNYRPLEFTALVETLEHTLDWDAILIGFTGGVEPHNGANLLRSSGNLHLWNPNQPKPGTEWERTIDELVERGARELDVEKRRQLYWQIEEILHRELPMIQTVRERRFNAVRNYVQNYDQHVWGLYRPERISIAQ
ncbi:MAG: ABC transporter substrate-binding protein [Deltaproteobacteria bacterium]|nr:ABC transporter substrate-binding protein [Deltaproteobacteria bacterium]